MLAPAAGPGGQVAGHGEGLAPAELKGPPRVAPVVEDAATGYRRCGGCCRRGRPTRDVCHAPVGGGAGLGARQRVRAGDDRAAPGAVVMGGSPAAGFRG